MPQAERILIVRLSAIGDVVHGLPVLCALRAARPGAFLAWAAEPAGAQLLDGHPALDGLVKLPKGWLKSPGEVWRCRRRLREFNFDTTLDLQGLFKSAFLARLSGAPRRFGFAPPEGRELSHRLNTDLVAATATHVVDKNLQLLSALGLAPGKPEFRLAPPPAATAAMERYLTAEGLGRGFAAINPGAGWESKLWPRDRYAEVARHLFARHGLPTLAVWAGETERGYAAEIATLAPGAARVAPPTTLHELAALLASATLCVGPDTGPLHLAAALGTRSVGLFGPMPAERNGLYGERVINLQEARFEGGSRERRHATPELMAAITAQHVCDACDALLQATAPFP